MSTFGAATVHDYAPCALGENRTQYKTFRPGTPPNVPKGLGGSPEQKKQDGATFPAPLIYPAIFWLSVARSIREREARS